ncbi:hypothetical protein QAD02_013814 [Eretmocerus hayati]|uniref:Uncharacterized protein n=1 Tax=Eretmocerus hayati TaxID=131215 RepID=A0ACC2P6D9_9HYME|nr:hypothetical protein QAD02_013814 [Eretmocerus hayati]
MRTVRRASLPVSEMDEHVLESFRSIVLRIAHHLSIWSRRAGVRRRCAMYHRSELRQTRDIDLLSRAFSWLLFSCPIRDLPRYHRRFFPSNRIAILAAGEIVRRRDTEHLPALNHLMEEYREMQVQPQSPGGRNPITTESSGFDIHELQNSLPAETSSIPCAQPRESSHTETQRQPQESQPSDIATNDSSPGALPSTQSGGGLGAPASANAVASEDIDLQVRPAGVRFTVVDAGPRYVRRFRINGRRLALRILPPPQGTLNPILWLENGRAEHIDFQNFGQEKLVSVMNHARKMVIIPEEKFARMQTDKRPITPPPLDRIAEQSSDKTVQTVGDNLSRLDAEMYAILASKSKIDERDKCIKYLQILRRYLFFKGNERDVEQSDTPFRGASSITIGEILKTFGSLPPPTLSGGVSFSACEPSSVLV